MKLALVYDRVNKLGGAEKVLLSLHNIWPNAPLFTSVYDSEKATWADEFEVKTSFLNRIPGAKNNHEYLAPLMPYAFESLSLSDYDVVVSVTSAEAKGVMTSSHQLHINYMLTPTRYLWSKAQEYSGSKLKKAVRLPWMSNLRRWDWVAGQRPDHLVAISKTVASRVNKYYSRRVEQIIYPPVDTDFFSSVSRGGSTDFKAYYLIVSRLVKYKQVEKVIKIFNEVGDKNLVVVGEGREYYNLLKMAGENVRVVGGVSQVELRDWYQNAVALIFPQEEDFGITAVESMAAGTPVIGLNSGGAAETVVARVGGILIDAVELSTLKHAMEKVEKISWSKNKMQQHAKKFDKLKFEKDFKQLVEALWQQKQT